MTRSSRYVVWLVASLALLAEAGCSGKDVSSVKRDCRLPKQRAKKVFAALCAAWDGAVKRRARELRGVRLARADLPPETEPPNAPLVVLSPDKLVIDAKVSREWSKRLASAEEVEPCDGRPTLDDPPTLPTPSGKGAGMLTLLSALQKRDAAARCGEDVIESADSGSRVKVGGGIVHALWLASWTMENPSLLVAIEPATPAEQVAMLFDLVQRAGYARVDLLVAPRAAPVPPPQTTPPDRFTEMLGSLDWLRRPEVQRVLGAWAGSGCLSVLGLFQQLAAAAPAKRCAVVSKAMEKLLTDCGCRVDERPLLALIRRAFKPIVSVAVHRVHLDPKARGVRVTDPKQPWREVFPRVLKVDAKRFRLHGFDFGCECVCLLDDSGKCASPLVWGGGMHKRGRPRPRGPRVVRRRSTVAGGLDATNVRLVVWRNVFRLESCYRTIGLKADPQLTGLVKVGFRIDKTGRVRHVVIKSNTLRHGPTLKCIRDTIGVWRFPRPKEPRQTQVVYAFRFVR